MPKKINSYKPPSPPAWLSNLCALHSIGLAYRADQKSDGRWACWVYTIHGNEYARFISRSREDLTKQLLVDMEHEEAGRV